MSVVGFVLCGGFYSYILRYRKLDIFPDAELPDRLFNGTPFKQLPIFNIRVSKNNTIVSLTDYKGIIFVV